MSVCVVIKTQEINFGTEIETLNVDNDVYFMSVLFMVDLHVGVCDCLHLGSLGNKTLGHVIFTM